MQLRQPQAQHQADTYVPLILGEIQHISQRETGIRGRASCADRRPQGQLPATDSTADKQQPRITEIGLGKLQPRHRKGTESHQEPLDKEKAQAQTRTETDREGAPFL